MPTIVCNADDCEHNSQTKCTLSTVTLDDSGTCEDFEEREDN